MPERRARHTVHVKRHQVVGDDYGTPVYGWGDPEPVRVFGWASPQSTEPKLAGHDRVVVDVEVFSPERVVHHRDKVILDPVVSPDSDEYDVQGEPEDYTHGPTTGGPGGFVWNLTQVEG